MMIGVLVLVAFVALASGRPSDNIVPQNVVTVPPNCPEGQEWFNGACRDVWRYFDSRQASGETAQPKLDAVWFKILIESLKSINDQKPHNVISVPNNCPAGQQWLNGSCRDVWRSDNDILNVITVPTNCPTGQEWFNGACRDVWIRVSNQEPENNNEAVPVTDASDRNVISVPSQCPVGYKPDALGICREVFP